ncbi:hypothetical protein BDZ89DRAFT_1049755 [Hymenopellis radicata]|nr:hypothetical protein BDZ89DRAFT_1049755 [Hymenopellis radicata]
MPCPHRRVKLLQKSACCLVVWLCYDVPNHLFEWCFGSVEDTNRDSKPRKRSAISEYVPTLQAAYWRARVPTLAAQMADLLLVNHPGIAGWRAAGLDALFRRFPGPFPRLNWAALGNAGWRVAGLNDTLGIFRVLFPRSPQAAAGGFFSALPDPPLQGMFRSNENRKFGTFSVRDGGQEVVRKYSEI